MMPLEDVTLGELYRLLQSTAQKQDQEFEKIDAHLRTLNGRTSRNESDLAVLTYQVHQAHDVAIEAGKAGGREAGQGMRGLSALIAGIVSAIVTGVLAAFGIGR